MKVRQVVAYVFYSLLSFTVVLAFQSRSHVNEMRKVSVTVVVPDGSGSGVLSSMQGADGSWDTFVWTDRHVVTENLTGIIFPRVKVLYHGRSLSATVVAVNEFNDLALLHLTVRDFIKDSVKFYHSNRPLIEGTPIWHIGSFYGTNLMNSLSIGVFSNSGRDILFASKDQITCPIYPGSSGGGVFNSSGKCVGLVEGRIEQDITFITPSRVLTAWAATLPPWHGMPIRTLTE